MLTHFTSQKPRDHREHAQAIVEFAIVLPILLVLLVGILEVGRMIFIYAAVNNASREAARYASAWGLRDDGTTEKFNDCTGIKEMAKRSAFFVNLSINIYQDDGPGTTPSEYCGGTMDADDIAISSKDRVTVKVTAPYKPMVNLIPFPARNFESISSRTLLGILNLNTGTGSSSTVGGGSPTDTPTPTEEVTATVTVTVTGTATATSTPVPGATDTNTPTATQTSTVTPTPGGVITFTPMATGTDTPTLPPTSTPTITPTMTPTFTPTPTSTPVPGCDQISHGSFQINGTTMSMTIRNPHEAVTVSSIQVTWNQLGGPKNSLLALRNVNLGTTFWVMDDSTGSVTIPATTTVTIPGNNTTTTISFIFSKAYQFPSNNSVTISLSSTGCEGITIHNP